MQQQNILSLGSSEGTVSSRLDMAMASVVLYSKRLRGPCDD